MLRGSQRRWRLNWGHLKFNAAPPGGWEDRDEPLLFKDWCKFENINLRSGQDFEDPLEEFDLPLAEYGFELRAGKISKNTKTEPFDYTPTLFPLTEVEDGRFF